MCSEKGKLTCLQNQCKMSSSGQKCTISDQASNIRTNVSKCYTNMKSETNIHEYTNTIFELKRFISTCLHTYTYRLYMHITTNNTTLKGGGVRLSQGR